MMIYSGSTFHNVDEIELDDNIQHLFYSGSGTGDSFYSRSIRVFVGDYRHEITLYSQTREALQLPGESETVTPAEAAADLDEKRELQP